MASEARRRKEENPKLQPKYVGPYTILQSFANHTYKLEGRDRLLSKMSVD